MNRLLKHETFIHISRINRSAHPDLMIASGLYCLQQFTMATVNPQWNAIASLISVKFDKNNYILWKSKLCSAMYSQDLLRYVDNSFTPPPEKLNANSIEINPEYIKWKCTNQLVLSWILSTVSESIPTQIISYDMAREA
ncbi:hypothetical protein EJ110_NYTH49157 [Nymphaea thermarum]|nr:hypothetical protein EJ110_NYTH49157 [Nymphaea thermarum]